MNGGCLINLLSPPKNPPGLLAEAVPAPAASNPPALATSLRPCDTTLPRLPVRPFATALAVPVIVFAPAADANASASLV